MSDAFFRSLHEYLKMYFVTGGMPEPVNRWVSSGDVHAMNNALEELVKTYEYDFLKHINPYQYPKISLIWNSLPSQLARENKKFLYKAVKQGACYASSVGQSQFSGMRATPSAISRGKLLSLAINS